MVQSVTFLQKILFFEAFFSQLNELYASVFTVCLLESTGHVPSSVQQFSGIKSEKNESN